LAGAALASCIATADFGPTPQALKPIPIPAASCPYLRAVHATAERAGAGWGDVLFSSDRKRWRRFAVQVGPKLAAFDLALRAAIPNTPRPVATRLRRNLRQVEIGRARLTVSRDGWDYFDRTHWAVITGYENLSDASDLVGHACGFTDGYELAPDAAVAFSATTTTTRGSAP
jgi:hypothetical protein